MDSWQQKPMSRRQAQPGRPPPKVAASLSESTGTEQQMVAKLWPVITHPAEKMSFVERMFVWLLSFAATGFFIEMFPL